MRGSNAIVFVGVYVCCRFAGGSYLIEGGLLAGDDEEADVFCSVLGCVRIPGSTVYGIIPGKLGGRCSGGGFGIRIADAMF